MATPNFSASLNISWKYWVFSWVLRREYPCTIQNQLGAQALEIRRVNPLPGVKGSRFVKFFSAMVRGVSKILFSTRTRYSVSSFVPLNWKYFPRRISVNHTKQTIGHSPRIHILPLGSILNLQTSSLPTTQPLVGIRTKVCVCRDPRTTRGRKGHFPPRVSYGTSRGRSRLLHLGSHSPCLRSAVRVNRRRRERPIRC